MFYEKTVRLIENENEGLKMREIGLHWYYLVNCLFFNAALRTWAMMPSLCSSNFDRRSALLRTRTFRNSGIIYL